MRLREIKKQLDAVLSDDKIRIESQSIFNGYGYQIGNANTLFNILELLKDQRWNDANFDSIQQIINKYNPQKSPYINLDQSEYSHVVSYVDSLNQKLPFFVGVIDNLLEEQNPYDINIKLSKDIDTPQKLKKLIDEISELAKLANIDGNSLRFSGFDKGTDWIVITAMTPFVYAFIMSALKFTKEYFKTRQAFFESKNAELSYWAALKQSAAKNSKFTDKGFGDYKKTYLDIQIEQGIESIDIKAKETNGFTKSEIKTKLKKATECMIKIIDSGNEVHISINPPKEVTESIDGDINIDYSILDSNNQDLAKLQQGKKVEDDSNSSGESSR